MTDTTITAPVQHEAGVLEHLDPAGLVIETNVRTYGVLVPVLGWRDADGAVHVRAGQRRTLAAREARVGSIPVYVVQADDEGTAVRIVEQLVENEHRRTLADTDHIAEWLRAEWALLSPHVRAARSDALRECIRGAADALVPRSAPRCPPRSRRWGRRWVSGVLPCPGLPPPRCGS